MVFHSFALHCEDINLYDAAGVRSYCLVFVIKIIIGPKKGSDVELENGTKAMVTKLTSITDKIIKCRTNDKSSTEGKCPKSFQSIRGKTIADCLGQGVVDILRFADRSSFGQLPSFLASRLFLPGFPCNLGLPHPCNLSQTEVDSSSRRQPNPAF